MPVKEKSASSGVLSWLIAAAKIKSKNSSVQSGRRTWCSWAGHNFGALRNRDLTSELSGKDPFLLLSWNGCDRGRGVFSSRSEEHTSELQSPMYLVCRLLLEKKK